MATATEIVSMALSFLGISEDPPGSNTVVFNTDYYGAAVKDGTPKGSSYPWCCTYVWDVFRLCNASSLFYGGRRTAYCPAVMQWGKTNQLTVPKTEIREGDLILFDWNANNAADHIGIAIGGAQNGYVDTVEGNVSNKVSKMHRPLSQICCVIRPLYTPEAHNTIVDTIDHIIEELRLLREEIPNDRK